MKLKYPLAKKLTERVSVGGGDSDALQMKASSSKKSLCSPYFIFAEFAGAWVFFYAGCVTFSRCQASFGK